MTEQPEIPKKQRRDARSSREALLTAAREQMAEGGPNALTVVSVAKRAGLNRSTAYQHFRTREQLLRAVGVEFADELRDMFDEPRHFGAQIDFFVHYFLDHPDIARIWLYRLLAGEGSVGHGWGDYVTALARLARSARSQEGIDAEMLGVIGLASALVWSLMARLRADDEEAAREQTQRFAHELKRLFLFGALRPEEWPELVAQLQSEGLSA